MILLRQDINDNFLNLFTKVLENEPLVNGNKLNLFVLKISNNAFNYNDLSEELENALINYALSRNTLDELVGQKKYGTLSSMAKEKLRNAHSNEGEIGELLLYCLLESHLHAPKLLTKLELKTASNDYVKGADGVHLLQTNDNSFQIVFGESKLYANLQKGIKAAFDSIRGMMHNGLKKMRYEIHLANSNILKECVSEEMSEILKKILIPTENNENLNIDNSFGIFLGFDLELSEEEYKCNNQQFRDNVIIKTREVVLSQINTINSYLSNSDFWGYSFYLYAMPFSKLEVARKEMINKLINK